MKRITILFDDEYIYRDLKAEAAKEGRSVKDVVAEALSAWLASRGGLTQSQRQRRLDALRESDAIRQRHPVRNVVEEMLEEVRNSD